MSFAVPNRDFKVVYYDKYTGVSITHVLTVLGYQYFSVRKENDDVIGAFLTENLTYIITVDKKEYMWFPIRAKDTIYGIDHASVYKAAELIPDHMNAVQMVLDSIPKKAEKKASSDDLVTVYHDESDFIIFHARTFKAFQIVATRAWIPDGESGWEYAMSYNSNRIFVLHIGDQKTTGKKFVIIGSAVNNNYAVYDENGTMMAGTSFHLPVKNALDDFCKKLQLTA